MSRTPKLETYDEAMPFIGIPKLSDIFVGSIIAIAPSNTASTPVIKATYCNKLRIFIFGGLSFYNYNAFVIFQLYHDFLMLNFIFIYN